MNAVHLIPVEYNCGVRINEPRPLASLPLQRYHLPCTFLEDDPSLAVAEDASVVINRPEKVGNSAKRCQTTSILRKAMKRQERARVEVVPVQNTPAFLGRGDRTRGAIEFGILCEPGQHPADLLHA